MKVIYVSSACSKSTYKELIEKKGIRNQQQSQKYNYLLAQGIKKNNIGISMLSIRPINRNTENQAHFDEKTEIEDGIEFKYIAFMNLPILRNITVYFNVLSTLMKIKDTKGTVVLCDALNISASLAVLTSRILKGLTNIAIVTDVPCHRPQKEKPHFYEKLNLAAMKRFSGYLLLTEEMNNVVNPNHKPYIVLEGHVDELMAHCENDIDSKTKKKVCIYAGSTKQMYGIDTLIKGFLKADIEDSELHIYGSGDYDTSIIDYSMQYPDKIKYHGVVPNEQVVRDEITAWLLINPRPTDEDYTKYSFPSKNMEYMASGTPVLTTKLPGMPKEYYKYVYIIEDETEKGIADSLVNVLLKNQKELHEKGIEAKNFVLKSKNNVKQAQTVVQLMTKLLRN